MRMTGRRWLAAFLIFAAGTLSGCKRTEAPADPISRSAFLLNTFVTVTLYDSQDQAVLEGSLDLCRQYEELLSNAPLSDSASGGTFPATPRHCSPLRKSFRKSRGSPRRKPDG